MKRFLPLLAALPVAFLPACSKPAAGTAGSGTITAGKFTIVATMTDGADTVAAKSNAENALRLHPDLAAMAGLYGYNPPACLEAVRDAAKASGKPASVRIFGFDGLEPTLAGIKSGEITGTIVQQPFEYGYQSMKSLKALADGQPVTSRNGTIDIPVKVITKDNIAPHEAALAELMKSAAAATPPPAGAPRFVFITNNNSSFWDEARAGCLKAQAELGITVDFQMPDRQEVSAQNAVIENVLNKPDTKGVAITVMSADAQADVLAAIAAKVPLVTHDSDAPSSPRKLYHGMDNYSAGRELGKLIRSSLPDGGKIAVFVGSMDAQNARERQQGMIDELSAKP
ncbi:MAG: ribose transport system substrate-binding protein [Verrucomicrobia bacterium]|jgi:ribose transport system substrate-binding protein|nr:MAG: ribose transport system substrate-binding protein [Verrucomicrobiota bacterium]